MSYKEYDLYGVATKQPTQKVRYLENGWTILILNWIRILELTLRIFLPILTIDFVRRNSKCSCFVAAPFIYVT